MRPALITSVTVTIMAAVLWGIAGAGIEDPDGVMSLDRSGAVLTGVIAAMCWGILALMLSLTRRDERQRREYRRREAAIIRSAAKRDVATTKPLPLLRAVPKREA